MPKIDTNIIRSILHHQGFPVSKVAEIMQEIELELQAEQEEKAENPPPIKKQFCIIISDPSGAFDDVDVVGWVAQIPEDISPVSVPEKIIQSAYDYNATKKGMRLPVETIGEACEVIPAKFFKEFDISMKTKTPVLAVPVRNQLPKAK